VAILAAAAVIVVLALLLGPITSWAGGSTVRHLTGKNKADAINGVRQTLLQAAAGTAALTVLVFTGLTFTLNRRGQVTDRYTKAIGLLASEKLRKIGPQTSAGVDSSRWGPLAGSRLARGPLAGPRDGPSRAGRCQPVSRQDFEAPPPRRSGTVQRYSIRLLRQ
jgi:hypothetical protein